MGFSDFFAGEIAVEVLKHVVALSRKAIYCRSSAQQLINYIRELLPIIQEIKFSGVELPQHRQRQLDNFSHTLLDGIHLATKVINASRWNVYQKVLLARKMEKFEKTVSRFMSGPISAHVLADVHHVRVGMDERFDRLEWQLNSMKIGVDGDGGGLLGAAVKRMEEESWYDLNSSNLVGAGLDLGKKKVKEMLLMGSEDFTVFGIHGIGGSGKTTLAKEICKDNQIKSYFNNRVFFLTVSQSPNVKQLRAKICGMISGNTVVDCGEMCSQLKLPYNTEISVRSLVVLDDVWSQLVLEQLIIKIPGCKFLIVSRSMFPTSIVDCSYALQLLSEDDAISLFCHSAFGQTCIPITADKQLVKQVVDECKGLPLALKVIGASLKDQSEMFWIGAKNRLSRSQPLCESHEVQLLERMKMSIDYLKETERECFLDLGAFPEDKKIPLDILINMWVDLHDIDGEEAFTILVELSFKNLLTLVKDPRVGDKYSSYYEISVCQHDVLRDLAIHLSSLGCVTERTRLLMPRREAVLPKDWERNANRPINARVISVHTGEMREMDWFRMECPKTEVLILNFSSHDYFLPPFIDSMPKLRAIILINYRTSTATLHNTSVLSKLTNLRSLWFEKISVPVLDDATTPLKNLQKMSLILCDIKHSLDHSTVWPHLFPSLSELIIDHCINLFKLPSGLCRMQTLKSLSVTNCESLRELSSDLGKLNLLQILRLYACPNLKRLPSGVGELARLKYLDISQCVNLESFPDGMGGCASLEKIDMRECPKLKTFPVMFSALRSLHRVICDEEISWLWKEMGKAVPGLSVQVPEECFTLDWLND